MIGDGAFGSEGDVGPGIDAAQLGGLEEGVEERGDLTSVPGPQFRSNGSITAEPRTWHSCEIDRLGRPPVSVNVLVEYE